MFWANLRFWLPNGIVLQIGQGAAYREDVLLGNVGVDHSGTDILVSQEFLDSTDVVAGLDQMGGEGVAKGVGRHFFGQASFFGRFGEGAADGAFVEMVPSFDAGTRVDRERSGGEQVLPLNILGALGFFLAKAWGK